MPGKGVMERESERKRERDESKEGGVVKVWREWKKREGRVKDEGRIYQF